MLTIYGFIASSTIPNELVGHPDHWWNGEVWFANWSGLYPCTHSTNVAVASYYTGFPTAGLRDADKRDVSIRLESGDTLLFGADYYALTGLSSMFFVPQILMTYEDLLQNGGVIYCKVFKNENNQIVQTVIEAKQGEPL